MPLLDWLNVVLNSARAAMLPLVLFALIAATVASAAARRRRSTRQHAAVPPPQAGGLPLAAGTLDVEAELRAVLRQLESLATDHRVGLELAVQPGLTVRSVARGWREIVHHLLVHAISHAPGGRVLLGAFLHGGRIHVAVTDDGSGAERALQQATLRPAERLATLQGATLEIDARPGQGTIVMLRLAASSTAPRGVPSVDAAGVWGRAGAADSATATSR